MLHHLYAAGALAACIVWASVAAAAEPAGYHAALFNGRDLEGWQITGCDVAVEDGLLVLKGGDGFVRTNETHGDFVLELDWRALKADNYDSGIYLRAHCRPRARFGRAATR